MPRVPIGEWVDSFIQFLLDHFGGVFDGLASAVTSLVNGLYWVLHTPPYGVVIAVFALLAWVATRRWQLVIFTVLAFLLIVSMELWTAAMQTLTVVLLAAVAAVLIGVPIGVWAARSARTAAVVRPVLDFMQTLPVFVYLIPSVFFFGIGVVPGTVSTTLFAIPPAVRLTELGIRQVDTEIVEAAHAFGSRPGQILRQVQLPLALPSIMAGVNQVIMLALSMVVIAGMVGAGGLGEVVVRGVTQLDIGAGFEGGLAVVILAIYLDRVTGGFGSGTFQGFRLRRTAARRSRATTRSPEPAGSGGRPSSSGR
ncbi:ABC transporter permease [Cryptosporangium aurantiacum]|uniref:Glycine betaine/proline transport system permease protein n=1 Tax=Cryptosporangium aurantiacum TaxID=134849 RepID=A0A1M7TW20_9ACTN|nr:proline/glycine betaine ABC transporter permease [Cryptosporangium aurantiacum]SHN74926.1 glycine betaine/proline transport system permease protein [Cryptosporangium aurantiacum]